MGKIDVKYQNYPVVTFLIRKSTSKSSSSCIIWRWLKVSVPYFSYEFLDFTCVNYAHWAFAFCQLRRLTSDSDILLCSEKLCFQGLANISVFVICTAVNVSECEKAQSKFSFQMFWVLCTVTALGGVLARDGESCVPTRCWDINSCAKSVKVRPLFSSLNSSARNAKLIHQF